MPNALGGHGYQQPMPTQCVGHGTLTSRSEPERQRGKQSPSLALGLGPPCHSRRDNTLVPPAGLAPPRLSIHLKIRVSQDGPRGGRGAWLDHLPASCRTEEE